MRIHVWFGAGRLLIPVKGEETISWLCGEVSRRLTRRLGKETTVEGLRTTEDGSQCLNGDLVIKDVVQEGGAFVAVMAGDPEPAPPSSSTPVSNTEANPKEAKMAVCVQCGKTFNETEERENERQGRFPTDPAQICRFHAQPPQKFLWTFHYTCCNSGGDRDIPCRGGFHRSEHHTDYPYANFVPYASKTMGEIECEWYRDERKDLGDGKFKFVRVAQLTEKRVCIAITVRQAQLPRIVDISEENTDDQGSRTVSFRLLKVFELNDFLNQLADKPLEWKDKDNSACWARFSVVRSIVEGAFGVKIEWQCSSEAKPTVTTVIINETALKVLETRKDTADGCGVCTTECCFGGSNVDDVVFEDEAVCEATIVQCEHIESPLCSVCNAELRVEQLAPMEASQDQDVLNDVMAQRFSAKIRLTNVCDHEVSVSSVSAEVNAAEGQSYSAKNIMIGFPMANGEVSWVEEALPLTIAPNDNCELMWSAKIPLRGVLPGHDDVTRRRAHGSLGSQITVNFNIFTTDPKTEEPQMTISCKYSNDLLSLQTRDMSLKFVDDLPKQLFPSVHLADWCSCDDVETLWRHFVAIYQIGEEKNLLLKLSEQAPKEVYVLDKDYYQYAVQTCIKYSPVKGYHEVPVVDNDYTKVTLLVHAATHSIAALKTTINAKNTKASCTHYFRF